LLTRSGGFDEAFSAGADWDLWLRFAAEGRAEAVSVPLVAYRPSSWVVDDEAQHRADCERLASKHPEVSVDWLAQERWIADSLQREGHPLAAARRHAVAGLRHGDLRSLAKAGASLFGRHLLDKVQQSRLHGAPDWVRLYA
jgi:hypothetical protein